MNSAIEAIQHTALKHSRRATRLWKESVAVFRETDRSVPRDQVIRIATELNDKAIDECRMALHSIEFLRRYRADNA